MTPQARVVIIGGGAMGVSLLYHLAARGWNDCVLVERQELTAGSTWHAAGLCTHFAHSPTIMQLRARSIRLYREGLTAETGLPTGFHGCGALRITRSPERMLEFRHVQGIGAFLGHEFRILTPAELQEIYPLCRTEGILGAIHEPNDGHVDPTLATNAMAAAARARGAEIQRHNPVLSLARTARGDWLVETARGPIRARHVVNAAGTWCREIGAMMGIDLPVVPMLHQYLVTATVPAIEQRIRDGAAELPIIRDPEESWYLRQERDGFILGPYETDAVPWAVDGVPPEFGMELMPPDLERIEHIVLKAMARVPDLGDAGIKTIVNGPITFTPDGNPLIGPAHGVPNGWLLTGSSMGVMEGGGAGAFLADWIVDGEPPFDALAVDARRFGAYADRDYRLARAIECFGLQFGIHYPFEERAAGRPRRTTPALARQQAAGAVLGVVNGWERPNVFVPGGDGAQPEPGFRRPDWMEHVRRECLNTSARVGSVDLSAFSKFEVTGPGAAAFMERLGANRPPARDGRIGLVHALTAGGGVASEFTVTRLDAAHWYLNSAAAAELQDFDLLRSRCPDGVEVRNLTQHTGVLGVMGPLAAQLLQPLCDTDISPASFPWLAARRIGIAGIPVLALRVSYVGEYGFELHAPLERFGELHAAVTDAGERLGHAPFGIHAVNSMRLEKAYRGWGADLGSERTPLEAGLDAFVRCEGRDFPGRDAMLERAQRGDAWRMQLFRVADDPLALPFANHTVWQADRAVGIVTSAAFGFRTGSTLALAYLRPDCVDDLPLSIRVTDRELAIEPCAAVPWDPSNERQRPSGSQGGGSTT